MKYFLPFKIYGNISKAEEDAHILAAELSEMKWVLVKMINENNIKKLSRNEKDMK